MDAQTSAPDPVILKAEAEREAPRRGLESYLDTIRLLKEDKGFSYREIAAWLKQRGVTTDHNAIWRAYSKQASAHMSSQAVEQIEHSERTAGHRAAMPWL